MPSRAYTQALKQIRTICLALPEAAKVEAWGHPTFRAGKKMFAAFGEGVEGQSAEVGEETSQLREGNTHEKRGAATAGRAAPPLCLS
jgi:hypothetical protein